MSGGPRFTHVDDERVPWQEVRRQQHGDRVASIRERWLDFGGYLALYALWDPGMMVHAHGHNSDHVILVLDGEMTCGDVVCTKGTHIALDKGDTFGPFIAGPDGVALYELMMGDPRSFAADPAGWEQLCAARGVTPLPNPPVDLPDHLPDTRT